jgi:DNA transposition AAA+ family ATPase
MGGSRKRTYLRTTSLDLKAGSLFRYSPEAIPDPTTLILVDEADRLQMNSLEMMRSIFDAGKAGMVLIGMPGIEKRIARFPQFYSLEEKEITELLNQGWVPVGVTLPNEVLAPDVIASLIRMSGGNFRLLTRLLTQIERILKVNQLDRISKEIVAAARDSLVIGQV